MSIRQPISGSPFGEADRAVLERLAGKQDGVDIGIVTTEGKLGSAAYPLAATTKQILHYYNNYFGGPYPLAKLDQIAIPGGFNGAMENRGGIVYNEAALLYDPKKRPENVRQLTFGVNAHEMAHQRFGNLVTMAWWAGDPRQPGHARQPGRRRTGAPAGAALPGRPVGPKFSKLGWLEKSGELAEDSQVRVPIAGARARAGDPAAIAEGRARFARYLADPAGVSPSMIDFMMNVAGRYADQATWVALAARAMRTESNEERNRIGRALTPPNDPALAARTLEMALSPKLPAQLTTTIVPAVAANEHIDQAWAFAVANREVLMKHQDALAKTRRFRVLLPVPATQPTPT